MLSINDSLNKLQLRMQEPYASFEPIPTQDEFINFLQWTTNRPFYSKWGIGNACGSGEAGEQRQAEDNEVEEGDDAKEDDEETASESDD